MSFVLATTCRLCGCAELPVVLRLAAQPWADDFMAGEWTPPGETHPLHVSRCARCGHVQLREVFNEEKIFREYASEAGGTTLSGQCHMLAQDCAGHMISQGDELTFIDLLGAKNGGKFGLYVERALAPRRVRCFAPFVPDAMPDWFARSGVFWDADAMRRIHAQHGPVDCIMAFHFLHNLHMLRQFCEHVAEMLAPQGIFSFESFYLGAVLDAAGFDFLYHEHVSTLHLTPLLPFFTDLGLDLFDAVRTPHKGGSILCHVQKAGGGRARTSRLLELLGYENHRGLSDGTALMTLPPRVETLRQRSREFLDGVRARGAHVCCYGASATTTTLLTQFGLNTAFDFIVDDDPRKQGLLSPCRSWRVQPPHRLSACRPDYVYIAAWRYARQIMAAHREYLKQGGAWIVPLPQLKIIRRHNI